MAVSIRFGLLVFALAIGLSGCGRLVSGERDPDSCVFGRSAGQATCLMEAGRDGEGWALLEALVSEGDQDAVSFWADVHFDSGDPSLRTQARTYGRQLAFSGDRLWVDAIIREAAEARDAGPIIELRCALNPHLNRHDVAGAVFQSNEIAHPSDAAWFATVTSTALTSAPARSVADSEWAIIHRRLSKRLPGLDFERALFEACPAR